MRVPAVFSRTAVLWRKNLQCAWQIGQISGASPPSWRLHGQQPENRRRAFPWLDAIESLFPFVEAGASVCLQIVYEFETIDTSGKERVSRVVVSLRGRHGDWLVGEIIS
jgi:hypothetical protein